MGYQQEVTSQLHWILLWGERYKDTANTLPNFCVRDYFHYVCIVRAHSYPTFYQNCPLNHRLSKVISATLCALTWDHHDVKQPQNFRLVISPCWNTLDKVPMTTISLWLWITLKFEIVCLHCNFWRILECYIMLSPPESVEWEMEHVCSKIFVEVENYWTIAIVAVVKQSNHH
jgi:hypothetical protein